MTHRPEDPSRRGWLRTALVAGTLAPICGTLPSHRAHAQAGFPDKPLRLVIPYAAGGPTDVLGRRLSDHLARELKQPVVVVNRPGASGIVAMESVAKAPADGYTLLLADINIAVTPAMYRTLPFDPSRDFASIGMIATAPMLLLVPPSSPIRSAAELLSYAKANPGKLSFASAGIGSPPHLAGELTKVRYGLDVTHVPFNGAGPALTAVAGDQVSMIYTGLSGAKALVDGGRLRALAITGTKRAAALPDVPTLAQAGVTLPELDIGSWWGLVGPAGLPGPVLERLSQALNAALAGTELAQQLAGLNYAPAAGTPAALQSWIASETRTWGEVLQRAGIRPE